MANLNDMSIPVFVDSTKPHARIGFILGLPRAVQRFIPERVALWWIMRGLKVTV